MHYFDHNAVLWWWWRRWGKGGWLATTDAWVGDVAKCASNAANAGSVKLPPPSLRVPWSVCSWYYNVSFQHRQGQADRCRYLKWKIWTIHRRAPLYFNKKWDKTAFLLASKWTLKSTCTWLCLIVRSDKHTWSACNPCMLILVHLWMFKLASVWL